MATANKNSSSTTANGAKARGSSVGRAKRETDERRLQRQVGVRSQYTAANKKECDEKKEGRVGQRKAA